MNKEYGIRFLRISLIIFCVIFIFYGFLPKREWKVSNMNHTVGEDRVDILCVGSSHVQRGINPIRMYDDKGFAVYNLAIGSQAPWQTYYYIKEACKTQKPQIIICDTYLMGARQTDAKYQDYQTVSNLLDCPLSVNKIMAVLSSRADSKIDIILNYPYSHDEQFTGFSLNKIYGTADYSLGYEYCNDVLSCQNAIDANKVIEREPISKKNEKYLKLIIDFCKKNSIELILINTPWPGNSEETQMYYNYISDTASEYMVPFIDGCKLYEKMGIDYSLDCSDDGGHLNDSGVTKFTVWIENYIQENYKLNDRRGNEDYSAYDRSVLWLESTENTDLTEVKN